MSEEIQFQTTTASLLSRIDTVLVENRRIETVIIICTVALFAVGIACIVAAICTGEFFWATPSIVTTFLLKWPLEKIQRIHQDNIALATVPAIIECLPPEKAVEEFQKLIQKLYGSDNGQ